MKLAHQLKSIIAILFFGYITFTAAHIAPAPRIALVQTAVAQSPQNIPFTANDNSGFVPCGNEKGNPCTFRHLFAAMIAIINYLIATAGFVAVAMIIYSSLRMIWSRGDMSKLAEAKGRFSGAVIGIVLVAVAYLGINAMFSGSFSLGIKDGALILSDPIKYISLAGSNSGAGTNANSNSGSGGQGYIICINRKTGSIDKLTNDTCTNGMEKTKTAVKGPLFCVYKQQQDYTIKSLTETDPAKVGTRCQNTYHGDGPYKIEDYKPQ